MNGGSFASANLVLYQPSPTIFSTYGQSGTEFLQQVLLLPPLRPAGEARELVNLEVPVDPPAEFLFCPLLGVLLFLVIILSSVHLLFGGPDGKAQLLLQGRTVALVGNLGEERR